MSGSDLFARNLANINLRGANLSQAKRRRGRPTPGQCRLSMAPTQF
ncbi:MAG: hypothetical protein ACK40D_11370 [Cyanobacteriota bacterium]